jgi:hypothetical protein
MRPNHKLKDLPGLLDALCDQLITAEQMHHLEELLLAHPEARAYYVEYMSLYADLVHHFGSRPARTARFPWGVGTCAHQRVTDDGDLLPQAADDANRQGCAAEHPLRGL